MNKARWVVRGFLGIPDIQLNPGVMYAPDASLLVMISMVVRHNLHFKQLDVKTAFLKSPVAHDVWV